MIKSILLIIVGFALSTILMAKCGDSVNNQPGEGQFAEASARAGAHTDTSAYRRLQDITVSRKNAITVAVESASPAVVGINVTQIREFYRSRYSDPLFDFFFGGGRYAQKVQSLGSGFIISEDGYIVTNEHVVNNADEIVVTLWGGERYNAEIIGADYESDIALLKIDGKNLPTCVLGNSDDVLRGEWVIALGNPFGLFDINSEPSVNVGVVSNINMDFGRQESDKVYQDMIQTDAQINSGNSGGPLLNSLGEVIGMNTWILSGSRDMSANIGIGFAIPINQVKQVIRDLREKGTRDRNFWTGLEVDNISGRVALVLGLNNRDGVIITNVEENSPGERAQLQPGDVIVEINGIRVTNYEALMDLIRERDMRAGDIWKMKIFRRGKILEVNLTLESPKNN